MTAQDGIYIFFVFALGACVGSFLNVVVWRVPQNLSLVTPGSFCPNCKTPLAWYDNLPVIGWLKLRGKCRYCKQPISVRYPIIEALCGLLFVFYYVCWFFMQRGPCEPRPITYPDGTIVVSGGRPLSIVNDWPMYGLYMYLVATLLAASLIDAELFIIPVGMTWLAAAIGVGVHTMIDYGDLPGALVLSPPVAALSAGGTIGFLVSMFFWWRGIFPQSFAEGEPALEVDKAEGRGNDDRGVQVDYAGPELTRKQIFTEIRKEMLFLSPPLIGALAFWLAVMHWPEVNRQWSSFCWNHWVGGFLGSAFGALMGGFVVWITRILGTFGFGRVAMGLGDVHLMFGVGAIIGAGAATVAFFLAPFFGILVAIYFLLTRTRRELPYGPYLSMAVGLVMIWYAPIATYLRPGFEGLGMMIQRLLGGGGAM